MNPQVSQAASTVKHRMGLTTGPVLDELLAAAEQAQTVADLPAWARAALAGADPEAPDLPVEPINYAVVPEADRGWVDLGERMLGGDQSLTITSPPPPGEWSGWDDDVTV